MSDCQTEVFKYRMIIIGIIILCAALLGVLGRLRKRRARELEVQVHERTAELKKYVDSLQRSQAEKSFLLDGISKRINASLATMKGLGTIAMTYDNMPPELVRNIDITTDTLADILQQIAREKKL